jgi:TPP-dependent pyruvate/acetoin dehydrogenase alpha subunit
MKTLDVDPADLTAIKSRVDTRVNEAVEHAQHAAEPDFSDAAQGVYTPASAAP